MASKRQTIQKMAADLTETIDFCEPQKRTRIRLLMACNEQLGISNNYLREITAWLTFEAKLPNYLTEANDGE